MAAGDINDPLSNIPNVVMVDQSSASAAPGVGYARVECVNGVVGARVGAGAWASFGGEGAPAGLYEAILTYQYRQNQNTDGGTNSTNAWTETPLNTEVVDSAGIGSVAANRVTLPAGTYDVSGWQAFGNVTSVTIHLYDVTHAAELVKGSAAYINVAGLNNIPIFIAGSFTLAETADVALRYYSLTGQADHGLGQANNLGTEIYASVTFQKRTA